MHTFDKNIKDLDIIIPDIAIPIANYVPYKLINNILYILIITLNYNCNYNNILIYKHIIN